jgi:glycosyltransferase involved in cell wall biosynthesis
MSGSYYHLFCVRDSEKSIDKVMNSLLDQTIPPKEIIVVNDGSTDRTSEILESFQNEFPNIITVYKTQNKTRDYSRIPTLWNMCLKRDYDFHMVGAGDVSYEKTYAEKLLTEFNTDSNMVIASGDFEPIVGKSPHGAGRFVRQSFFFKYYDKYPEIMGYESEILNRALIKGYKVKIFNNVKMEHHEKLGHGHNFEEFGRGMRALGYHPVYVMGRCFLEFVKNNNVGRRGAMNMFWKYITYKPKAQGYFSQFPEDIRKEISDYQSKEIRRCLKNPKKILKMISGN